jgi:hypothetical protein
MDEYNSGMDPEVKRYFRRIINSFSYALFWLLAVSTAGLYFGLAFPHNGLRWYNWLFYLLALATLLLLIRYFLRSWKKEE